MSRKSFTMKSPRSGISRRAFLASLKASAFCVALGAAPAALAQNGNTQAFSHDIVKDKARMLSLSAYQAAPLIPQEWRDLSYDEFGHIWFDPRRAVWAEKDHALKVDLFTAGLYVPRAVRINAVEHGIARQITYDQTRFARTDKFPDLPIDETMGYSGFRLRTTLKSRTIFEEFMVFQGASYFRAIAKSMTYGLSARGLALGTASSQGEEFPDFTEFWIEEPNAPHDSAPEFIVHALLDGPSITGAYQFHIRPQRDHDGEPSRRVKPTTVDVSAELYPRVDLDHVGIAPLTSMFFFDETNRHRFDDFRSAVHDSEGLLIHNGHGEQIWRPLANPVHVEVSAFVDEHPKGFGLMQRTRNPESYADFEAHYENRPSLWIAPKEDWGAGRVELIEIPAEREIYDNIVAYWRPDDVWRAGKMYPISYTMHWGDEPSNLPPLAKVINTRIGKGFDQIKTVFTIDFEAQEFLKNAPDDYDIKLSAYANTPDGVDASELISPALLQKNLGTKGVRAAFSLYTGQLDTYNIGTVELRAQMFRGERAVSEVWLYRWTKV